MPVTLDILKRSKKSRARLGVLKTSHGEVQTPALVTVATQATVKALSVEQAKAAGSQLLISNTYHLHLKPGEQVVKKAGGIHKFMHWDRPLMTDSGGFQVFSLGFGRDLKLGKIGKKDGTASAGAKTVGLKQKPKLLKITEEGVTFTSHLDGRKIFMGPEESMKIQAAIGADIIFAFDECTPPTADYDYTAVSLDRTHRWAERSLKARDSAHRSLGAGGPKQALFGVVQGGKFKDLRKKSAQIIGAMDFDGFGIGGEFGDEKKTMTDMLRVVMPHLPEHKPRHLLGIGHPEDIVRIIKEGVDTFDCTVPTQYGRHGSAFTSAGRVEIHNAKYVNDNKPLDRKCPCPTCTGYSRAYLAHLFRAKEILGQTLLTQHNLWFFNAMVTKAREDIKKGKI